MVRRNSHKNVSRFHKPKGVGKVLLTSQQPLEHAENQGVLAVTEVLQCAAWVIVILCA